MPKLIENLRERILHNAKAELLEMGYDSLTIRSVAKNCGIAVGTVYNYFPSKEMLAAEVMLEDWLAALKQMQCACNAASDVPEALTALYTGLRGFTGTYHNVWAGYAFSDTEKTKFHDRHKLLVRQLADCMRPALNRAQANTADGYDIFLAENVLICTGNSEMEFDALLRIVERTLQ